MSPALTPEEGVSGEGRAVLEWGQRAAQGPPCEHLRQQAEAEWQRLSPSQKWRMFALLARQLEPQARR